MTRIDSFFHKPTERTQEEAKRIFLCNLDTELRLLILGFRFNQTYDKVKLRCELLKRQIRMVENNLCQRAVWNRQSIFSFYENNTFYENMDEYRNIIRIDDIEHFRNKTLKSYEECTEFFIDYNKKYVSKTLRINYPELTEFWQKYPNGLIKFM